PGGACARGGGGGSGCALVELDSRRGDSGPPGARSPTRPSRPDWRSRPGGAGDTPRARATDVAGILGGSRGAIERPCPYTILTGLEPVGDPTDIVGSVAGD